MHKSFHGSSWSGWRDLTSLHSAPTAVTNPYWRLQTSLCCQLCFSWYNSQLPISVKMNWIGTDRYLNCLNYLGFWMKQARDDQQSSSSSRSEEEITLGRRAVMSNWCWVRACSLLSWHCCKWKRVAMDSPGCPASACELGACVHCWILAFAPWVSLRGDAGQSSLCSACLPGYTKCSGPSSPLRITSPVAHP